MDKIQDAIRVVQAKLKEATDEIRDITGDMTRGLNSAKQISSSIGRAAEFYWRNIFSFVAISFINILPFVLLQYRLIATLLVIMALVVKESFF